MIPQVLSYALAERCDALMDACLPAVRREASPEMSLATTFALTMAMPLIVIPLERLSDDGEEDSMRAERPGRFVEEFRRGMQGRFGDAPFRGDGVWYAAEHEGPPKAPSHWGWALRGPVASERNRERADASQARHVMWGIRHALSHGCVAYLDDDGNYAPARVAGMLAFAACNRAGTRAYIRAIRQDEFIRFLKGWAAWLQEIGCGTDTSFWHPKFRRAAD